MHGGYENMMEVEAKDNGGGWNGEEGLLLPFSSTFFVLSFSSSLLCLIFLRDL